MTVVNEPDEEELTGVAAFLYWFLSPFFYAMGYVYGVCVCIGRYLLTDELPN